VGDNRTFPKDDDGNGDYYDSIGMYRCDTFSLMNSTTKGIANMTFTMGQSGDVLVIGDWKWKLKYEDMGENLLRDFFKHFRNLTTESRVPVIR
jgi:hypothetical protein